MKRLAAMKRIRRENQFLCVQRETRGAILIQKSPEMQNRLTENADQDEDSGKAGKTEFGMSDLSLTDNEGEVLFENLHSRH